MRVYRYDVDGSRHCREGVATKEGDGLFDTFWRLGAGRHRLTDAEAQSATLMFDTVDYDELDVYAHGVRDRWEKFAPADRECIPSQHGLQHRYFVRRGASPDLATQIENARRDLDAAQHEADMAVTRVSWAREKLDELLEKEA